MIRSLLKMEPATNVCKQFRIPTSYIHRWLQSQPEVKEESVTDWLLYEISRRLPCVTYRAFSRHEEARETGADWEWWLLFPENNIRLRVQAKKLAPQQDNYSSIARTNRHGLQIEMFLKASKDANAIPLYAFYSALKTQSMRASDCAGKGVFMAGGRRVYDEIIDKRRKKVSAQDLLAFSTPLTCFACCRLAPLSGDGFYEIMRNSFFSELGSDSRTGIHRDLPHYVLSLLERSKRERKFDGCETNADFPTQDFKALFVCDFRQPEVYSD